MARFRPDPPKNGSGSFLGFQEVGILDFRDDSSKYDWADVYVVINLGLKTSKYPVDLKIAGSWNKDPNGNIEKSTLLNSIYYLLDAVGYEGGPNRKGEWEDSEGKEVDLVLELNREYSHDNPLTDPSFDYYVYVYKQWNENDQKAYTRVARRIEKNTTQGKADLESWIAFMKEKGYLKEWDEKVQSSNYPPTDSSSTSTTSETSF